MDLGPKVRDMGKPEGSLVVAGSGLISAVHRFQAAKPCGSSSGKPTLGTLTVL